MTSSVRVTRPACEITTCDLKTKGRPAGPETPHIRLEVQDRNLKLSNSSLRNWNMKSHGKRLMFRFAARTSTLVSTP